MGGLRGRWSRVGIVLSLSLMTYVLVVSAWQCDDAYITFRTVRNVFAGHGLTWNPGERVQAYTHPLWLLLGLGAYGVSGELFYSMSVVSVALSLAVGASFVRVLDHRPWLAIGIVLVLSASRAFVDFEVSGLENPLLSLLLVIGAWLGYEPSSPRRDLGLTLVLSLAMLTRTDALLLLLPIWALSVLRKPPHLKQIALGLAPLLVWELFSLFYYGSLVPNTALAKLNLDVPASRLLGQGLEYLLDSLVHDPITLLATSAASVFVLVRGDARARCLALGVLLYVGYVLRIGGDFMSGRFLVAPLVLALGALALLLAQGATKGAAAVAQGATHGAVAVALPAAALLYLVLWPTSPVHSGISYGVGAEEREVVRASGIADERAYYYPSTGLLRVLVDDAELRAEGSPIPPYAGAVRGAAFAESPLPVTVYNEVGLFGYFAGDKQIVDRWALCDPLLARIPYRANERFRIGHYPRPIPAGYLESRATGENRIEDPRLREAYEAIRLVTRGPLWSSERLSAIIALGTGAYSEAFASAAARGEPAAPTRGSELPPPPGG